MVGGIFWDQTCISDSLKCLIRSMEDQLLTNESVSLHIGDSIDQLLLVVAERYLLNKDMIDAAAMAVKDLRCDCKRCSTSSDRVCARAARLCTN
jgi:hypothetical protein